MYFLKKTKQKLDHKSTGFTVDLENTEKHRGKKGTFKCYHPEITTVFF